MMEKRTGLAAALLGAGLFMCPLEASAEPLSFEAVLVSDYRYRGVSLSDERPALQASLTWEHDSGVYGNVWASTIKEDGASLKAEVDFTAGYAAELPLGIGLDLSATYYAYPGDRGFNYFEGTALVERPFGPVTAHAGLSYAPRQDALAGDDGRTRSNRYLFAGVSLEVPGTPLTLSAQVGHERGAFDLNPGGGKTDWSASAELALDRLRIGLAFVGTDAPAESGTILGSAAIVF
jgi:uncharacterized protein (TIGR02001 family)